MKYSTISIRLERMCDVSLANPRLKYRRSIRARIKDYIGSSESLLRWRDKHPDYQLLTDEQTVQMGAINGYLRDQLVAKW